MEIVQKYLELVRRHPTYTPVVTGHSLGGTAAVLFSYDLYEMSGGFVKARLQTFGQP